MRQRRGWAAASDAEIACAPTNSSRMNRLECQFTALREFAPDGTDHTHREQNSMLRRYIAWRNRQTADPARAASSNGQPQPDTAPATE
jgi:hypothetical protein